MEFQSTTLRDGEFIPVGIQAQAYRVRGAAAEEESGSGLIFRGDSGPNQNNFDVFLMLPREI